MDRQRSDGEKLICPGTRVQGAQVSPFSSKWPDPEPQGVFPLADSLFTSVAISASLWIQTPMQRETTSFAG